MKNSRSLVLICFFILLAAARTDAVSAILHDADYLINTKDQGNLEEAQTLLMNVLEKEPHHVQALCLMAKAHFYYGDWVDKQKRVEVFEQGLIFAKRAVDLDPSSPDAHYWSAALMGRAGEAQGILQSLFMVRPMEEHLERVLELDEEYGWAYYALSQLYHRTPKKPLSVGDKHLALEYARRAVELDPQEPEFTVHLSKLLIHQNKTKEAQEVLKRALRDPSIEQEPDLKQEAEELLRSISNP